VGCVAVVMVFGGGSAPTDAVIAALPHNIWSSFGYLSNAKMAALPNTLLMVTLTSNFGTFILYGFSCTLCMVAYHKHANFNFLKHMAIPVFGILANVACMVFYLVGPVYGYGSKKEPLLALGISFVWGIYGAIYFIISGKKKGRTALIADRGASTA